MREITVRESNQNFSQVIGAAERGETTVITKNGKPVAKIIPHSGDRTGDLEWRANLAALKKSLRSMRDSDCCVGTITEDDKCGEGAA
jgi:prevent-host-death family protein